MNQSRSAIALYMGLVFVSGTVLGVVGERFYNAKSAPPVQQGKGKGNNNRSPADLRRGYLDFMQKRFNLTADQVTKLGTIIDETGMQMDELHRKQLPEQQEIRRNQEARIREMLDVKQRAEYDARVERMNKDREERRSKNKSTRPGF